MNIEMDLFAKGKVATVACVRILKGTLFEGWVCGIKGI